MTVAALVIDVTFVFCLAAFLLHRYGDWKKQHLVVTVAAFISWYFPFMIIFVLPLDVSNTCYRQCLRDRMSKAALYTLETATPISNTTAMDINETLERHQRSLTDLSKMFAVDNASLDPALEIDPNDPDPCRQPWSYVPPHLLPTFWHVVYWTSQVLTWLILPMMQSYANAGDFTVAGKIKSALIENAIYYGTYLLIFGVCLIYIAVKPNIHLDGSQLKVLAITASNTWGLFLLVLLLGYGLVDVPRTCWNNSKKGQQLSTTYFKISKISIEKTEAEEELEDAMEDVKKAAETIKYNHPLRKYVDTILLKCPESVQSSVQRNSRDDFEDYNNPTETPTQKSLVRLHKRVIKVSKTAQRTQVQWSLAMDKAFDLEDLMQNENSTRRVYIRSSGTYEGTCKKCYNPAVEWYWKCVLRPWGLRVLTVLLAAFSIMVVWSECLFFVEQPPLSLFALFIQLAKRNYDYLVIEFVCFMTIAFLSWCAYYTIFKIRILNYFYLAAPHQTTENSLIFCGMLLCRLTPPLCLNFLGLIHLDSHLTKDSNMIETSYTQIMGHMDVIPFISNGFNIYFPILIVLLCIATYFRLGTRVLNCLGFQQFIGDDELTQELVDEGTELVRREKRRRQRTEDGENRRRNWNDRFGSDRPVSVTDNNVNRRPGSLMAKSPSENDHTELLKNAEPVDYTGQNVDSLNDFNTRGAPRSSMTGYQSQSMRPAQPGQYNTRPGPPRGIFDDV